MMMEHDNVIRCAGEIHQTHWRMSGNESEGDGLASLITRTWQERIRQAAPTRYAVEHRIAPHLKQRIDLVDLVDGIAYEL